MSARKDRPGAGRPSNSLSNKSAFSGDRYAVALLFDPDNDWLYQDISEARLFDALGAKYRFCVYFDSAAVRGFDLVFVLGYTKVLRSDFLEANKLTLVVHESNLPRGKGFSPVQWQVLEGKNEIPVSLIEATPEVDAGDILEKCVMRLDGGELLPDIRCRQAEATLQLMERFLSKYPRISRTPQNGKASVYRRRTRQDDRLDVNRSLADQFNALRIVDNEKYPAYFAINGHTYTLKIYRTPS